MKKVSINILNFAQTWYYDWQFISKDQIDKLIIENQDCIYIGEAYRYIGLDKNKCLNKLDIDNIKNQIKISDNYYSWSYSYFSAQQFKNSMIKVKKNYEFGIFIKCNITGLNLMKLYKKYANLLNQNDEYFYKAFKEEEIIAKLLNNYEIISISNQYDYFNINDIYKIKRED